MYDLPLDWGALCPLVFLLGLRHGLEADHLAAIDGLTRLSAHGHFAHSRYCGVLFRALVRHNQPISALCSHGDEVRRSSVRAHAGPTLCVGDACKRWRKRFVDFPPD